MDAEAFSIAIFCLFLCEKFTFCKGWALEHPPEI